MTTIASREPITTSSIPARKAKPHLADRYGPWAVVTGASDGIGREFGRLIAADGLNLVLVARRQAVLEALAVELRAKHDVNVVVIAADLSLPEGVAAVLDATRALDVGLFVASAGYGTSGPFLDLPVHDELAMIDVNCRAITAMTHDFGRRFAERGRGGIVLMSSLLAFQGVDRAATYAATKAFVQTFAEGLRRELAHAGVDVIASAPGPTFSGFASRAGMNMTFALTSAVVARRTLDALGRRTTVRPGWLSAALEWSLRPLGRAGRVRVMGLIMRQMTAKRALR